MSDRNPQAEQMSDESMIRTLASQVKCIWPQEKILFSRYGTPHHILDVGCGTGEFIVCLAKHYPQAEITGIEINAAHVARAQNKCKQFGDRVKIQQGDAFALPVKPRSVDLIVCRHLLQSIPDPEKVITQCHEALRPQGWLHLLIEDYTMIHFQGPPKFDRFWLDGPIRFGQDTNCDLRIGRRGISLLNEFSERKMDFIAVDTERVSRTEFANLFIAWRDGYSSVLAPYLSLPVERVVEIWDEMIAAIQSDYALWQVPIASGRKKIIQR